MQAIAVLGNSKEVEKAIRKERNGGEERVDMCQAIREMLEDIGMGKNKIIEKMIQKFRVTEEQAENYYNQFATR